MVIKMSSKVLKILLLFSIASLTSVPVQATTPWPIPEGLKTVEVNGYPMAYQDTGSGATIVLIHGSFSDYRVWKRQIPGLDVGERRTEEEQQQRPSEPIDSAPISGHPGRCRLLPRRSR